MENLNNNKDRLRVAVVYHYIAHYREPIFRALCQEEPPGPEYVVFSGVKSNIPSILTVNPEKAKPSAHGDGLNWRLLCNVWLGKVFLWQFGVIRLALSRKFNVIIYLGNMYILSTWISILFAKLLGKRTLMWTHGYLKDEKGIKGWIRERFYRLSDGLLLYGNRARDILLRRGFNADHLYVVYNSLDYETQLTVRKDIDEQTRAHWKKQLFSYQDWPVIISICRLTPDKQLDLLIKATALLMNKGLNVNVLFIGDGPSRVLLTDLVVHYHIEDRVKFYGACYDEKEIGQMISMADVCVVPGGIGLTCIHAMVYGTPVIAHDNPDNHKPEYEAVIPGQTGDYFKYGNLDDLVNTLERWLMQSKQREKTRLACQEIIDRFYTPNFQREIINEAVSGTPATRLGKNRYVF